MITLQIKYVLSSSSILKVELVIIIAAAIIIIGGLILIAVSEASRAYAELLSNIQFPIKHSANQIQAKVDVIAYSPSFSTHKNKNNTIITAMSHNITKCDQPNIH